MIETYFLILEGHDDFSNTMNSLSSYGLKMIDSRRNNNIVYKHKHVYKLYCIDKHV